VCSLKRADSRTAKGHLWLLARLDVVSSFARRRRADVAMQRLFAVCCGRRHVSRMRMMRWHVPSGESVPASRDCEARLRQRAAAKPRAAGTLISSHLTPHTSPQHRAPVSLLPMPPTAARHNSRASPATTCRCGAVHRLRAASWSPLPNLV
jgi:hypothetical protein